MITVISIKGLTRHKRLVPNLIYHVVRGGYTPDVEQVSGGANAGAAAFSGTFGKQRRDAFSRHAARASNQQTKLMMDFERARNILVFLLATTSYLADAIMDPGIGKCISTTADFVDERKICVVGCSHFEHHSKAIY